MFSDKNKDNPASPAPTRKTKDGELSHSTPRMAGSTTAAMWLMVNDTPALEAMSAGSAIFWK